MQRTLLIGCSALLLTCAQAPAATFSCDDATTPLQQTICALSQNSPRQPEPEDSKVDAPACKFAAEGLTRIGGDFSERSPLNALTQTEGSGVTAGGRIVDLPRGNADLVAWASAQTPPVKEVETLGDIGLYGESVWLEQLPGTNFYAIHQVGGSARCYDTSYFEVDRRGRARGAGGPLYSFGDGSACGVDRSFGTVDRAPAMFEERTYGSEMHSTLTIARRNRDRSWTACRLTFHYEPVFGDPTPSQWNSNCTGSHCARLREAAYKIVAAIQSDPQRDPAQIGKDSPLRVPYADGERSYVVDVGHFITRGLDYSADWSVTFREASQDGTAEVGSLAIGMRRGRITRTSIEAL
jgi:hypothetical protein